MPLLLRRFMVIALLWTAVLRVFGSPPAEHVFIFSIDGGKPAVIAESDMPVLKRLAAEGACTWTANTIYPSLTLPSHTSMLTGVGPDKHHVLWNKWKPGKGLVRVPTIFAVAKKAGLSTAMFVGKEKFRHLLQPGALDEFEFDSRPPEQILTVATTAAQAKKPSTVSAMIVAQQAAQYILKQRPNLCFIHFTDTDDAGHKYGWGSAQQKQAFSDIDRALATVLKAIEAAGIQQQSVMIVTADHGGHAKTHGLNRPDDMRIPWIAWGKDVKANFPLTGRVTTYDTAATALWLLGVPLPGNLDGRPILDAFSVADQQMVTRPAFRQQF